MKPRNPLNKKAYRKIKEYILNNDFYPGQHIRHLELSKRLKMSRTPAREAMQRLVEEGFLIHRLNRGYFVNEITEQEAAELYELREILETYCIRKAIDKGTSADLGEVREMLKDYEETMDGHVSRRTLLVDRNFHLRLAQMAGNELVYRTLYSVFEKIIMKRNVEGISVSDSRTGLNRHIKILDALERRDLDVAICQIEEHIREGKRRVLEQIQQRRDFRVRPVVR
jgi:GntR family transcriptional regulator, rspAB operon transcriptional repressor